MRRGLEVVQEAHLCFIDREDRLPGRCHRIGRPGRPARLLLSRPGPEGAGVLSHFVALQGQYLWLLLLARLTTSALLI